MTDLPSTARMLIDAKKLSRDLRVKELRGLASGLRSKGGSAFLSLAKLLSEVAEEVEQDASEIYRAAVAALEVVESTETPKRLADRPLSHERNPARRSCSVCGVPVLKKLKTCESCQLLDKHDTPGALPHRSAIEEDDNPSLGLSNRRREESGS